MDLRKSIILYPNIINMAMKDEDFDSIKDDDRFIALIKKY